MPRLRRIFELWPLSVAGLGFVLLGLATALAQTAPLLIAPIFWVVFPFIIAGGIFAWITQCCNTSPTFLASFITAFATLRMIDFFFVDRWPGMAVWLIVIGLVLTVWRQRRQLERAGIAR